MHHTQNVAEQRGYYPVQQAGEFQTLEAAVAAAGEE